MRMRLSRESLRKILYRLFWPAFILIALNVETWAERVGLDSVLADHASTVMSNVLALIQSAWVQIPALLVVGGSRALWADRLLRRKEEVGREQRHAVKSESGGDKAHF